MTYKKLLYSLDGITLNILTLVNGVLQEVTDLSLNVPILESGLIPARYLPSYVDDIIEGYYYNNAFYKDSAHTQLITGETGKIYVDLSTDLTYRWSGSAYVEVSKSIITGVKGDAESNYRVGNVNLTAANIGLANVANIDLSKAIKTITRSGTTFTYTCLDGTTGTFTQQDENTWRPITNTYTGSNQSTSVSLYGTNALYNALVNGYANSAGNAVTLSNDDTMKLYSEYSNEINFGGTNNSSTIYFSYRAKDSKSVISNFIFGSTDGTATITANSFKKKGGTSSLFLKADGSVDSTSYASGSFVAKSGDTMSGLLTLNSGLKVSGRTQNVGDDEGIVVGAASNGYAGVCLGSPSARRSVFYLSGSGAPFWRYNNGSTTYDITHPGKSGTIALTSDIVSGSYLPLSGGTISGDLAITGKCTNTASAGSAFRWGGSGGPHYIGNNGTEAYFYSGNSLGLGLATGGSWRLYITNKGTVSIGSTNPAGDGSHKIYVNGSGYFESSVSASTCQSRSDLRLKDVLDWNKNIDINVIASAPILTFKWKDSSIDNKVHIGTSAQYWNEYLPEAVSEELNGYLSMDYGSTALASSVRVAKEVVELKEKIKLLEEENKQLKEELELLKSLVESILTTINIKSNDN